MIFCDHYRISLLVLFALSASVRMLFSSLSVGTECFFSATARRSTFHIVILFAYRFGVFFLHFGVVRSSAPQGAYSGKMSIITMNGSVFESLAHLSRTRMTFYTLALGLLCSRRAHAQGLTQLPRIACAAAAYLDHQWRVDLTPFRVRGKPTHLGRLARSMFTRIAGTPRRSGNVMRRDALGRPRRPRNMILYRGLATPSLPVGISICATRDASFHQ